MDKRHKNYMASTDNWRVSVRGSSIHKLEKRVQSADLDGWKRVAVEPENVNAALRSFVVKARQHEIQNARFTISPIR